MASQPAVYSRFFLLMTFDTKSHSETNFLNAVHGFHCTVAVLTRNLFFNVSLVIEKDVLRNIVDFYPGRWRLGMVVPVLFFDPGMIGNNIVMAIEAFIDRRYPRERGTGDVGMAKFALDRFYPSMNAVAEGYGLFRADVGCRWRVEKIEKCQQ